MVEPSSEQQVDVRRARLALDHALLCAVGQLEPDPGLAITSADLAVLDPLAVRQQLDRILLAAAPARGLDALLATGVLDVVLLEVRAMVGFGDGEWRHKDVWKHTKQVVEQSVPRLGVRWAALLHDIGKVRTRRIEPDGEVHFIGHAEVGARMFDRLCRRDRMFGRDDPLREPIRFLVRHHLRASQYDGSWTDSAVRRFAREMGAHLEDLLDLSRADITTKRPQKRTRGIALIDELAERISRLAAEDARLPPLPTGIGNELMARFGLPPSRRVGELKQCLEAAVEAGEIEPRLSADEYLDFVAAHRERFGV